jgi:hypothetical protein
VIAVSYLSKYHYNMNVAKVFCAGVGAFSNTQRMVAQYLHNAYRLEQAPVQQSPGSA